jgi:hypothetical protein
LAVKTTQAEKKGSARMNGPPKQTQHPNRLSSNDKNGLGNVARHGGYDLGATAGSRLPSR